MTDGLHQRAEERSIALHAAVAERIAADPALLENARARVDRWLREGSVHPRWASAWAALLQRPLPEILAALVDPSQHMRDLRQSSPFAGVLDPRTRWRIWREAGARWATGR